MNNCYPIQRLFTDDTGCLVWCLIVPIEEVINKEELRTSVFQAYGIVAEVKAYVIKYYNCSEKDFEIRGCHANIMCGVHVTIHLRVTKGSESIFFYKYPRWCN